MIFFLPFSFPRTSVLFPVQHLSPYSVGHYTFQPFLHLDVFFWHTRHGTYRKYFESIKSVGLLAGGGQGAATPEGAWHFPRWVSTLALVVGDPHVWSFFDPKKNLFKEVINSILTGGFEHFLSSPRWIQVDKDFSCSGSKPHLDIQWYS